MGLDTDEGLTCEDIDECAQGAHNCESDDLCNNTDGTFNCDDVSSDPTEAPTTEVVTTEGVTTDEPDYGSGSGEVIVSAKITHKIRCFFQKTGIIINLLELKEPNCNFVIVFGRFLNHFLKV